MAFVPVIVLAGQSNAAVAGIDNRLFELARAQGKAFEFVKVAQGNTSLFPREGESDWSPASDELYQDLVNAVQAAMQRVISAGHTPIVFTLWIHGERDVPEPYGSAYGAALEQFITAYRSDVGQPESIFCISLLRVEAALRTGQLEVAARLANVLMVDPLYTPTWDGAHFERATQLMIAETFFAQADIVVPADLAYDNGLDATKTYISNGMFTVVSPPYADFVYSSDDRPIRIISQTGDDDIATGSGNDSITTYGNQDKVRSGGGDDYIDLGTHDDIAWAGSGNDTVLGREGRDVIYGEAGNDWLRGLQQDDILYGGDGDDILDGGTGADLLYGGLGNDTYHVDSPADQVWDRDGEGSGIDEIRAALTSYTINGPIERLTYVGSGDFSGTGNRLANTIQGASGNDKLLGMGGNDVLFGNAGNDILDGGEGADHAYGGAGNDIYYVDNPVDVVFDSDPASFDEVRTTLGAYTIWGSIEALRFVGDGDFAAQGNRLANSIHGGVGHDQLSGGEGSDALYGGEGNDWLDGEAGADSMYGGPGDDTYLIDDPGDRIGDPSGHDTILTALSLYSIFGLFEDLIFTGTGNFHGTGNRLDNYLQGGAGDDWLDGGTGRDRLAGGDGSDRFVWTAADAQSGIDTIIDFEAGLDCIDLGLIDVNPATLQDDAFAFVGAAPFSGTAGELRHRPYEDGLLVEGDVNGDGLADIAIFLQGASSLVATDFVL